MLNRDFAQNLDINIIFAISNYEKRCNIISYKKSVNFRIANPKQIAIFI